ncbi:AbgT family transporter, partial [Bittarella massiliensis (ex Durand et al. 2017)]|uniref:AbgT family transporter n=2 Tax=Clostridia TaxID=186801 RepID=UPI001AA1750E
FAIPGAVFGFKTGKFRNFADLADGLASAMAGMGSYIAMIFFMAQFMNYFDWSNLGLILAIKGAEVLKA